MAANKALIICQLVIGDFRERTRRYSYVLTLLGTLFFAYLVITGKYTVQFGEYRSVYNSAWFGSLMAVTCSIMLTLAGFYLVKKSISRDRQNQVGQIIAASPLSNFEYLIAKFFSNFLVLMSMVVVLAIIALMMLFFLNESGSVDLIAFSAPFLFITIPAITLVSAMAVFFDTVRWLRGSIGNIIYLFAAEMLIVIGMLSNILFDLGGINLFVKSVEAGISQAYPGAKIAMQMGFIGIVEDIRMDGTNTFFWNGIDWTMGTIWLRLLWIGIAGIVLSLAVPFFDRFDPAGSKEKGRKNKVSDIISRVARYTETESEGLSYTQIERPATSFGLSGMLMAELRLMLKGYHWSWYLIAAGLIMAQWIVPFDIARMYVVPVTMAWPLLLWSGMGNREIRYHTEQLLFSSAMPFRRQFPAVWIAGLLVALAAVGGMVLRALMVGHGNYSAALIIGALFIPSLAMAFGAISGSKKLFEVIYLIIWYVGSVDHLPAVDVLGTTEASVTITKMVILFLLSIGLLFSAGLVRRRQVLG